MAIHPLLLVGLVLMITAVALALLETRAAARERFDAYYASDGPGRYSTCPKGSDGGQCQTCTCPDGHGLADGDEACGRKLCPDGMHLEPTEARECVAVAATGDPQATTKLAVTAPQGYLGGQPDCLPGTRAARVEGVDVCYEGCASGQVLASSNGSGSYACVECSSGAVPVPFQRAVGDAMKDSVVCASCRAGGVPRAVMDPMRPDRMPSFVCTRPKDLPEVLPVLSKIDQVAPTCAVKPNTTGVLLDSQA